MKEEMMLMENVSNQKSPLDELAQMFRKNPSDELFLDFPSKIQNLTVFLIVYMIRIRLFGPRELFQKEFRAAW